MTEALVLDPDNMVYNQERLSKALQLFHVSAPYRRKRGLRADNLDKHLSDQANKYQLRLSNGVAAASASLWLDHDDSGDYNPDRGHASTAIHTPSKRKRAGVEGGSREVNDKDDSLKNKKPKINTWIRGRQNGEQLMVTLIFKTDSGKNFLRRLDHAEHDNIDVLSDADSNVEPSEWRDMGGCFSKRSSSTSQSYALRSKTGFGLSGSEEPTSLLSPRSKQCKGCTRNSFKKKGRQVTCAACRSKQIRCSAKTKDQEPCRACVETGTSCSFEDRVDDKKNKLFVKIEHGHVTGDGNLLTPPLPSITAIEISTSWAHPINYKHIGIEQVPCDFCNDYRYGMLGLGRVAVTVRRLPDDTGYEELQGGHRAHGHAPTKMCRSCALERLNIVRCPHHTIEALPDLDEDAFDFRMAREDLLATGVEKKQAQTLWCSICISPAFHACLTPQETDPEGNEIIKGSEESYGCGLVLCRGCAGILDALDGNLKKAEEYLREYPNLRADFDFVLPNSELAHAYASDN